MAWLVDEGTLAVCWLSGTALASGKEREKEEPIWAFPLYFPPQRPIGIVPRHPREFLSKPVVAKKFTKSLELHGDFKFY